MSEPPLLRPSELARFWKLHPRTVQELIRTGRLVAVRTPGSHFRVRVADVHAFCEREKMPVPDFLVVHPRRVLVIGGNDALARSLKVALRGTGVQLELGEPVPGLVAAVFAPPTAIAIDAKTSGLFAERAVRALRETPIEPQPFIVVFDVPNAAKGVAFLKAGATRIVTRARRADLGGVLVELATA